jgi:hypothetical protein
MQLAEEFHMSVVEIGLHQGDLARMQTDDLSGFEPVFARNFLSKIRVRNVALSPIARTIGLINNDEIVAVNEFPVSYPGLFHAFDPSTGRVFLEVRRDGHTMFFFIGWR